MVRTQDVEQLTITLPTELAEQARRAVADGRADSVSGYIRAAMEARAIRADEAWAEHFAAYGAPHADMTSSLRQLFGHEPAPAMVDEMIRRDAQLAARHANQGRVSEGGRLRLLPLDPS